ncbi:MAG: carbamoyltransferase C-terminal domain-containing protein [Clostridiales bacterium]
MGGSLHDYSSCLIEDGKLVCAVEEERVTRKKRGCGISTYRLKSVENCLEYRGITLDSINLIAINHILDPRIVHEYLEYPIVNMGHHFAHAGSTTWTSPFNEAAVLVIDNSGSFDLDPINKTIYNETMSFFYFDRKEKKIESISQQYNNFWKFNNLKFSKNDSLGSFYASISKLLGCVTCFGDNKLHAESGKLMALSAYGKPEYFDIFKKFIKLLPDGKFNLNLDSIVKQIKKIYSYKSFSIKADIASTSQKILEEIILHSSKYLYQKTKCKNICLSGGVALNGLANQLILDNTEFENIYIYPAAHDAGTCLGAAYNAYFLSSENEPYKIYSTKQAYTGKIYSEDEINKAIRNISNIKMNTFFIIKPKEYYKYVAKKICNNKVIAWFSGRSEFGPRALGNRSLICDVRTFDNIIKTNRIKNREHYRPFAPSVLKEYCTDYFMINGESPFMLRIVKTIEEKKCLIPAAIHIDGTARIQTVDIEQNKHFYNLIKSVGNLSGVYMVLNTSFNGKGMPIVETPEEAINMFFHTSIDVLCFDNIILEKV